MSKKYQTLFIAVLLNFNTLGVLGEEPEEYHPSYEYIQIFKNIPALFEYLLDALEERPEILEKSDVTIFKRNIDSTDNDECKSSDESKTKKRDVGCDNNKQDELGETNNIDKRDAESTDEITKSTKVYEYGNSNVVTKGYDAPNFKRFASKILSTDDLQAKAKREVINSKKFNSRRKRNFVFKLSDVDDEFLEHGEAFFGFEHFFGLDLNPEEIEERILTAEKLLEEYNTNKDKD